MVYPKFENDEEQPIIEKFVNLMTGTDEIHIDKRIPSIDACATRMLKKWLGLCKSSDPSILNRSEKGLGIRSVRAACLKAQVSKEVILCCSRDRTVRTVA